MKKEYLYSVDLSVLDENAHDKTITLLISYSKSKNMYFLHYDGMIIVAYKKLGNVSKYLFNILKDINKKPIPHLKYQNYKIDCWFYGSKELVNKNYENWIF